MTPTNGLDTEWTVGGDANNIIYGPVGHYVKDGSVICSLLGSEGRDVIALCATEAIAREIVGLHEDTVRV